MKKIIIITIIVSLFLTLFFVFQKGLETKVKYSTKTEKKNGGNISKKMPLFEFTTLKGKVFSKYNLAENKATIIVYFDPECNLCKKSGIVFSKFEKIHKNSNVLFVTSSSINKIKKYREDYNLKNVKNISFLQCKEEVFYDTFKELKTPTYLIYNIDKKLIKIINDDVPIKIILRYIKAAQVNA